MHLPPKHHLDTHSNILLPYNRAAPIYLGVTWSNATIYQCDGLPSYMTMCSGGMLYIRLNKITMISKQPPYLQFSVSSSRSVVS